MEEFPEHHLYNYLVRATNLAFSNVGLNATGGRPLKAPLRFEIVETCDLVENAHIFSLGQYTAIVFTRSIVDGMWNRARRFVYSNQDLVALQWAARGNELNDVVHLLTVMQASIVTAHEFTHDVRDHGQDLHDKDCFRAEEIEADGYGIYINLPFFFGSEGRSVLYAFDGLSPKAFEDCTAEAFFTAMMLTICSRWTRRVDASSIPNVNYPPSPLRLSYMQRVAEMWFREVGKLSTTWNTDETFPRLLGRVLRLFPREMKMSWNAEVAWLDDPRNASYRDGVEEAFQRLRKAHSTLSD